VVYDPVLRLPIDVFPCEDGHAQERSLLKTVLLTIEKSDVWIADPNFCTVNFTCGIENRDAFFVIREHKKYPLQLIGNEKYIGKTETGRVYEQRIDEISGTYRGMMIAIDYKHWVIFQQMTPIKLARVLKKLADKVKLSAFRKHPRGPKKPWPKRKSCKNTPHVSTAKILAKRTK